MAIIQINSNNNDLGFIIKKNPASGMQLKSIRQGTAFGWYSNNDTSYNIYFKDADNAVSFGDQEFEYLNTSKYNSPLFVLSAISEFFSSTVKEELDIDINSGEKSFLINMVHIKHLHQIHHFKKYFKNFKIEISNYVAKSYSVKITTNESFHKLFNYVNLMMLFLALTSDEYISLDENSFEKYLSSIDRLDAPFFIRYIFNRNLFKSKKTFEKYKKRLESTKLYDSIDMKFGDTATQRRDVIKKIIKFDKSIVDVGCGEGFYAIPFSQNIKSGGTYHAIDIDKNLTQLVEKKALRNDIANINVYNHIDEFIKTYSNELVDVILTEVIEHMPLDESKKLMNRIVNNINFDNFIITVPNKDFNHFYMLDAGEFRHTDHDWEPSKSEFIDIINTEIPNSFKIDFIDIGDTVNGVSTSIGCIISKK